MAAKAEALSANGSVSPVDALTPFASTLFAAGDVVMTIDSGIGLVKLGAGIVNASTRAFTLFEASRTARSLARQAGRVGHEITNPAELAENAIAKVKLEQEAYSAQSPNAAGALARKYKALENAQNKAVRSEILGDGRIRYYKKEVPSNKPGSTRGASYVTEYNQNTGDVHTWLESYDHLGNVNRIHPKMYNGQELNSPHYPPTLKDKLESEYYSVYRR